MVIIAVGGSGLVDVGSGSELTGEITQKQPSSPSREEYNRGDDPRIRLSTRQRTSQRFGPRRMGVGDRDRGDEAGWGACPADVSGFHQRHHD